MSNLPPEVAVPRSLPCTIRLRKLGTWWCLVMGGPGSSDVRTAILDVPSVPEWTWGLTNATEITVSFYAEPGENRLQLRRMKNYVQIGTHKYGKSFKCSLYLRTYFSYFLRDFPISYVEMSDWTGWTC